PHLKRYIDLSFQGHARQKEIGRKKKKYHNYTKPPFIYPDEDTDLNAYHLHCELSPPRHYRSMINELVYPVIAGNTATKHHHFGDEQFTVGVYGAFVSDCNHHCHPEIHPYEWLWWLNVHPDTDIEPNSKTWVFGLFREGSNRMPHWSPKPRTGGISIPFVFPAEKKELLIELHHLVFSSFNEKGFSQLNIPAEALLFDKTEWKFSIADDTLQHVFIILKTNVPLFQKAIKFWFSSLNYDAQNGMLSGKLHLATSADELYTAKVKFSY
ncbi:MAG TPA: hypothetical protein VNJ07_10340, partial [Chitinophagales bacterium]|nr:hypothetical protein [Chitinophagales bacterium]